MLAQKTFEMSFKAGVEHESFKSVSRRFHARGAATENTDLPSCYLDDQMPYNDVQWLYFLVLRYNDVRVS